MISLLFSHIRSAYVLSSIVACITFIMIKFLFVYSSNYLSLMYKYEVSSRYVEVLGNLDL